MAEARPFARRRPSLFTQIALRLAIVAALFAVLDVAIVIADYAGDPQVMAADFVGRQTERILGAERAGLPGALAAPAGTRAWSYVRVDAAGRPLARREDAALPLAPLWPTAGALEWTRRDATPRGVRLSGFRRLAAPDGGGWVLAAAEITGWRAYVPVIAGEVVDHVVVPLLPLLALLLVFDVAVVRRMLRPLNAAVAQADALDPSRMEMRIEAPGASREVAALVAALNRALDRLQTGMEVLKRFTSDAAHELRTPLSILQLRVEALAEGPEKRRLREDVKAMTRLVNQMLDISQADVLSLDEAALVDLKALAQEVVSQTALLAFAAGHDIRLLDEGAAAVRGHPDALGRALRNLIENAVAHAGGEGPIEVSVGPGARLAVRDHGQGLGVADPEVLFRRFWRKARERGGAGLGLGIARTIVEAHGGSLSAAEAPGGGALFVCELPPARAAVPSEAEAPRAAA